MRPPLPLLFGLALLGAVIALPAPAQSGTLAGDPLARQVDAVFADWSRHDTPGCIVGVARDGEVLYRRGYGMASLEHGVPMSPGVVSEIGSVSKQFTAAAVLLLARDGLLSLDDDVRQHIPELQVEEPLTLRRLADHTSGLRDWIGLMGLVGRPWGEVIHTVPEIVDLINRQRDLNFPPGERYLYSNAGYTLLLEVVERVSGHSFAEFTTERIFQPLGMEHTEWRDDHARIVRNRAAAHRPDGNDGFRTMMPYSDAIGSGGLISTVDDMIRWTEALHSGELGPDFLEEMTRVGVLTDGREIHYALGLQVGGFRGVPEVAHGGATAGYRAYLAHYPEDRLTVALQCNVTAVNSGGLARSVAGVYLADRLDPETDVVDPTPHPLPTAELARLEGLYRDLATEQLLTVEMDEGTLRTRGALSMRLIPVGESRFRRAGRTNEYVLEPVPGGGLELREVVDEGDPSTFVAVTPADPAPAELEAYVGRYRSEELDVTYTVEVVEGELVVRRPIVSDWTLAPTFEDAFGVERGGGGNLVFRRGADGAISGFGYSSGRILDVGFERAD
jgi:CubicO group peptidase (beta-lactamase class C family)